MVQIVKENNKEVRVHFIPYLKDGVFVTLCAPDVINNNYNGFISEMRKKMKKNMRSRLESCRFCIFVVYSIFVKFTLTNVS